MRLVRLAGELRALVGKPLEPGAARLDLAQAGLDPGADLLLLLDHALDGVQLAEHVLRGVAAQQVREEAHVAGGEVEGTHLLAERSTVDLDTRLGFVLLLLREDLLAHDVAEQVLLRREVLAGDLDLDLQLGDLVREHQRAVPGVVLGRVGHRGAGREE